MTYIPEKDVFVIVQDFGKGKEQKIIMEKAKPKPPHHDHKQEKWSHHHDHKSSARHCRFAKLMRIAPFIQFLAFMLFTILYFKAKRVLTDSTRPHQTAKSLCRWTFWGHLPFIILGVAMSVIMAR